MYEYLLGDLIGLGVLLCLFWAVPRLRRMMWWGALTAVALHVCIFVFWSFFARVLPLRADFVPVYWDPPVLFDLGRTLGISIEDLLFLFVMGGLCTVAYELLTRHLPRMRKVAHRHWDVAAVLGIAFVILTALPINPIYSWIGASTAAAAYLVARRPDLLGHSLRSGALFLVFYVVFFWGILLVFPWFVDYWSMENLSGIVLAGIPFEEYLWALSFGLLWGPLYEYVRHARVR